MIWRIHHRDVFCVAILGFLLLSWLPSTTTAESNTAPHTVWGRPDHPPPPADWSIPPPPPPQSAEDDDSFENIQQQRGTTHNFADRPPIHYSFPSVDDNSSQQNNPPKERTHPTTTSARQDIITRFNAQSIVHKLVFRSSCGVVGAGIGTWLGRSIVNRPYALSVAIVCVFVSFLRGNVYGELIQALAMLLILSFQRFQAIRSRYPVRRYVWASLGVRPLEKRLDRSEYRMYVLISMGLVGSFVGGSIPLIPTSLGSLAGAATFGLSTLQPTVAGDVCYCMGLRLVALAMEVARLNAELGIVTKGGAAASKLINTILVFDRKHRVQEKLGSFANWVRDRISSDGNENIQEPQRRRTERPPPPRRGGQPPVMRQRPPQPNGPRPPQRDGPRPPQRDGVPPGMNDTSSRRPRPPPPPLEKEPAKKRGFFSGFGRSNKKTSIKRPPPPPPGREMNAEPPLEDQGDNSGAFDDLEGWDFGSTTVEQTPSQ